MIYPQKLNSKKGDILLKIFGMLSIFVAIMLIVINELTTPTIPWAALANSGIIYVWIVVFYSIKKNINIAGHVLLQTIAISILTIYIDYKLGFNKWSLYIAIPIIVITSNITMLILTIVSHKKFLKYAIYQLVIVLLSMLPIILMTENVIDNEILIIVSTAVSIVNLVITLLLCAKDVIEVMIRKFHM